MIDSQNLVHRKVKIGILKYKWGPNRDPKSQKGPYRDLVPKIGTLLGSVL